MIISPRSQQEFSVFLDLLTKNKKAKARRTDWPEGCHLISVKDLACYLIIDDLATTYSFTIEDRMSADWELIGAWDGSPIVTNIEWQKVAG